MKLKKIVNLEDQKIGQNVMIKQSNMVDFENFDHPDKEDYSGWTGNEGASTTLWYKRSVRRLYHCDRKTYTSG